MSRIRTLKPEFFRSRSLAKVSRDARLTFAGLWVEADDLGRGIAHGDLLKGTIWPLDADITPEVVHSHLVSLCPEHIELYEVDGEQYYQVLNWEKHQAAAYRKSPAKYPPNPHQDSSRSFTILHDDTCKIVPYRKGREGNKEGNKDAAEIDSVDTLPGPKPSSSFDAIQRVAHQLARHQLAAKLKAGGTVDNAGSWLAATRRGILDERRDEIDGRLTMPADPDMCAEAMTTVLPTVSTARVVPIDADQLHPDDCECEGEGMILVDPTDERRNAPRRPCLIYTPRAPT